MNRSLQLLFYTKHGLHFNKKGKERISEMNKDFLLPKPIALKPYVTKN